MHKKKSLWHRMRVQLKIAGHLWRRLWTMFDEQTEVYHRERVQHPELFFERQID